MIKYAANAFLATKISFINEIADLCEHLGADVTGVIAGAGADRRIGTASFNAGLGFGGSCFPKDVSSLIDVAQRCGAPSRLLPTVLQINRARVERVLDNMVAAVGSVAGKRIGVLGLSFKANTDDVRESPALTMIGRLLESRVEVVAHDPVAIPGARRILGETVEFVDDCYKATNDADAVLIATDWNEYRHLDFAMIKKLMRGSVLVDARNLCDPARVAAAGLHYIGVGRSSRATPALTPRLAVVSADPAKSTAVSLQAG
jgi:UDPglucose 6-dehydrogenase